MKPCVLTSRAGRVFFTAPHACTYHSPTKGKKLEDLFTGEIAVEAARRAGCSAFRLNAPYGAGLVWRYKFFKEALHQVVPPHALLLDVHGAAEHHEFDVCFGTGHGNPRTHRLIDAAVPLARKYGLKYTINEPFAGKQGLTSYWQSLHGNGTALQLEFNRSLRDYDSDGYAVKYRTIPFLMELAYAI